MFLITIFLYIFINLFFNIHIFNIYVSAYLCLGISGKVKLHLRDTTNTTNGPFSVAHCP